MLLLKYFKLYNDKNNKSKKNEKSKENEVFSKQ